MAHPGKLSSLVIKNTLSVRDIWADSVNIKNKTGSFCNVTQIIDSKLAELKVFEDNVSKSMVEINKIISELNNMKTQPTQVPVSAAAPAVIQVPGPVGPQGKPGKGLRGPKGDTVKSLISIPDVDNDTDLVDGAVLMWSASKKKWIPQVITE